MSNPDFPIQQPDEFGQILTAADVRDALDTCVNYWAGTYIGVLAERTGQTLEPFGVWEKLYTERQLPGDLTAAYWSTCSSTDPKRPPERTGDGWWKATWLAESNVVVNGLDWQQSNDLTALYLAAVRAAVLQHRSLGTTSVGPALAVEWIGEGTKMLDTPSSRNKTTVGVVQWRILMPLVVNDLPKPAVGAAPGTQDETFTDILWTTNGFQVSVEAGVYDAGRYDEATYGA